MKKTSIKNAEYQRAEKGLTQCCKVSVSHQDVSRAAEYIDHTLISLLIHCQELNRKKDSKSIH